MNAITISALKFVSGETKQICRLCFNSTVNEEVSFKDFVTVRNIYITETVTFMDIFHALGVQFDHLLPQILCLECANTVVKAFLFYKLCQHSNEKWNSVLEQLKKSLIQSEQINTNNKSAFIMFNEKESISIASRTKVQSKTFALRKIKSLKMRSKELKKAKAKVPCKYCLKSFPNNVQLKEHEERVHYPKVIQCEKCEKKFGSERMLHRHDNIHHVIATCNICRLKFPSKMSLKEHLAHHQSNKCEKCNKTFKNRNNLTLHLKICGKPVSKDPKFFCDLCSEGFPYKNRVRTHLIVHHGFGKVLSCKWCKKKFDAKSRLIDHIVTHTKERNFCCVHCGNMFLSRSALIYHTRIHTGEKPYPCDLCNETFLSASRRNDHKRRKHWPMKQCLYCNEKFSCIYSLKRHTARHKNSNSKLYVPMEQ